MKKTTGKPTRKVTAKAKRNPPTRKVPNIYQLGALRPTQTKVLYFALRRGKRIGKFEIPGWPEGELVFIDRDDAQRFANDQRETYGTKWNVIEHTPPAAFYLSMFDDDRFLTTYQEGVIGEVA